MQDWTTITRNYRKSGRFAGTTRRDEDAYFTFFADDGLSCRTWLTQALGQRLAAMRPWFGALIRRSRGTIATFRARVSGPVPFR